MKQAPVKLSIHQKGMLRIPQFSIDASITDNWDKFKASVLLSSPEFYEHIKAVRADEIYNLPFPKLYTVWKYFNRSKYRPVPYGSFAGFGLLNFENKKGTGSIQIENEQFLHVFKNWSEKDSISIDISSTAKEDLQLFSNSSYYKIKNSIRYISFFDDQYQLSSVDLDEDVLTVLLLCSFPVKCALIVGALKNKGFETENALQLIDSLISVQLLFTSLHPNIIGQDYFKRLNIPEGTSDNYVMAQRKIHSGNILINHFDAVPKMISRLSQLLPVTDVPEVREFIKRFALRFGDKEISIMIALDPECGVGYGDFEYTDDTDDVISYLAAKPKKSEKTEERSLKRLLTDYLMNNANQPGAPIDLEKLTIDNSDNTATLPNSLSVLLSFGEDLIYAESIGGCTANALMGRFSITDSEVINNCKDIAKIEQEANPEVIFFDIGYVAEKKVDNINRRGMIYKKQLNILNYDTSEAPLILNDLLVSVHGEELVLRSAKLNKRLIPRLSSAYNYTRSDLPLFRFLCDLQSYGLQTNLTIDLQEILSDLPYYPRVQYKNIVLSPAKWKINFNDNDTSRSSPDELKKDLIKLGVSRFFLAGSSDQTLCFDQEDESDMKMLMHYLSKKAYVYIKEAFITKKSPVKDSDSSPYHAQFLLNLYHTTEIYNGTNKPKITEENLNGIIPPGQDWIYFEIYCHWHSADQLLMDPVALLLKQHKLFIEKWFFIRYNENGHHLRLRINLKNSDYGHRIIENLSAILKDELTYGIVSDILIRTYKRETQRYSGNDITDIEAHFNHDSLFVMTIIGENFSAYQKYKLCENLTGKVKQSGFFDNFEFGNLVNDISSSLNSEHNLNTSDFKKINMAYKKYQVTEETELDENQKNAFKLFSDSFIAVLAKCRPALRGKLFSDLLHMHFNRLFASDQRSHEMIFYYFIVKKLSHKTRITSYIMHHNKKIA